MTTGKPIEVFGLKNCDTTRKAVKLLEAAGRPTVLHDLRKDGLEPESIKEWIEALGWEALLNKRSTTWRGLEEAEKADLTPEKAEALMLAHPSLIKRPLIKTQTGYVLGLSPKEQATLKELGLL